MRKTIPILLGLAAVAWAGRTPDASEGFAQIQALGARSGGAEFDAVFPAELFGHQRRDGSSTRTEFARMLAAARLIKARQKGDQAVVRLQGEVQESELPLEYDGQRWTVAAARTYPVSGPELVQSRGRKPATVRLTMRTQNGPYGTCAYSLAHATGDAALCKNRMDLWYCHNGDLHAVSNNRIASLGKKPLKSVTGIPVGVTWGHTAPVKKGHVYVVHCVDQRRKDFYAVCRVKAAKRGVVELQWSLLTGGFKAPPSIHAAQPLRNNDGADGTAGLCGRDG